jgi:SSS family solute:Na+ symporter
MAPLDWLIVLVLNGVIFGYGIYLARGTTTSSEWFLGARALPWWAVGISMFATNLDNADLVSVTGSTYSDGIHIISVYALGSAVGGILAAFCVVPVIYRAGFYTNAEYLEARFDPSVRALSALIQIQYRGSMLGLMMYSAYLLLTRLLDIDPIWAWTLIVALVIVAGIYTAWGGLKTVVWTDSAQGVVMMVGAVVIFVTLWRAVGGWGGLTAALEEAGLGEMAHIGKYRGDDGRTSPYVVVVAWSIVASGYWTVNHTQTMRLMGSRSLWDMKMAALWGVTLSLPIMIISALMGLFAHALPGFGEGTLSDEVYPLLAKQYLTIGLKGLVVAGVVAAITSTFDSMGSALSAIFTRDIYARFLVRSRDDAHYVFVGRIATIGVLAVGFLYLPFIFRRKHMVDAFITLIPVFVTPLLTVYVAGVFTKAHRRSGIIGLVAGSTYGVLALRDRVTEQAAWFPTWFTTKFPALCWSVLFTGLAILLTTLILGTEKETLRMESDTGWLARSREQLPALRDHPFERGVPSWLKPELWAVLCVLGSAFVVFLFW